eukprot:CAMPEP_0197024186 /NCGR_PEP_ID=MMETSP1384-20130603/4810_1 /TAXON_ID=29189 /ORGANISM="Ammonia sp." /LENGTH=362 /DNA_ID=CAMNT_0042452531 /DNA_START=39 /DNA_END=1127 /DNA_ORIENTATION=+
MFAVRLFLLVLAIGANAQQWDYDDPDKNVNHWPDLYPECAFQRQSPIDLPIGSAQCDEPLLLQWESILEHFVILNTGHSLKVIPFEISTEGEGDLSGLEVLHHRNDTAIKLTNSFYNTYESQANREYCFDSLHFHWATTDDSGSEHTANGQAYPLEMHLVHFSCDYLVASQAVNDYASGAVHEKHDDDNVLAVVGVFFEIGEANPVIEQMLEDVIMEGVSEYHDPADKFGDHLLQLYYSEFDITGLLPTNKEFIAYKGSLTTPPCYETVRWHVLKETMTVSQEQMDKFRSLLESTDEGDLMAPNYRPVQALNDRTIYECQEQVDAEQVKEGNGAGNGNGDGYNRGDYGKKQKYKQKEKVRVV